MAGSVDLDLSGLPIAFLEAYEWPAFVLVTPLAPRTRPRLISRDTDITVRGYEDVSPLSLPAPRQPACRIAWSNEKWLAVAEGRTLDDCIDGNTESKLLAWAEATEGKGNVFQLSLRQPAITLNLARAFVPLSPISAAHQYCVIMAQPAPSYVAPARGSESTIVSPNHRSSTSTDVSYFDAISNGFRDSFSSDPGDPTISPSMRSTESVSKSAGSSRSRLRRRPQPTAGLSDVQLARAAEHCWELVHSMDWSKTALGPRSEWASYVDPLLSVVFQSKTQDCLWLGKDLHLIYNMNYAKIIPEPGHPWSFGQKGLEAWKPIRQYIIPFFERCFQGESIYREHDLLSYETLPTGEFCERYHTWRYNPVRKNTGEIFGVYNQSIETTEQVIAERRLNTVRDLSEHMLVARNQQQFYGSVAQVFEGNAKDAPFMLAYSVHIRTETAATVTIQAKLESTVGVPAGHPSATQNLYATLALKGRAAFGPNADKLSSPTLSAISALSSGSARLQHSSDGTSWPIARALQTRQCVIVEDCRDLISGYPIRAWDALPHSAAVIPICQDSSIDVPDGVIILGLSVRRPFDEAYESWVHVIRSQLASTIVSVRGFEEETRRRQESENMEKAKQTWFKGAAHDLRSPLNLIIGPLEDTLDSNLSSSQRVALNTAKRNVERLMRLVDSLMDFSRLEAGKVEGKFVPMDLGTFVHDVAALFRPAIERMRIEYHIEIEPSERLVFVDPLLFEKILSNMIGNALKYTEKGSITVRLRYGKTAIIEVIDTGVGIPQQEIGQVTDWYHRATTAVHNGCQGTGLGLALVRELLTLHDGELTVVSKTAAEFDGQHGSTFTATLPLTSREVAATFEQSRDFGSYGNTIVKDAMRWTRPRHSSESESGGSDPASESWTNSTAKQSDNFLFDKNDMILVVDDNLDMRQYLRHLLAPYCTVFEAANGLEAMELALKHRFDLVISDYMMPKLSGLDFLAEFRKNEKTRITPFIMISAVSGDETKVEALIGGAEDYLSKPFKPKELIARAHLHLQVGKKRAVLEKMYAGQKAEVALLADLCPSGIMRGDLDGHVVYGNAAWRKMAGMTSEENPDNWPQYVEPSIHETLWESWGKFINGTEQELALSWKWLSGRTVSALFVRLDLAVPGTDGILGCLTDITHEVEQLAEAESRRIEAENAKAQQELLIDFTSHEIRGPVSSVLNSALLVKENLASLKDSLALANSTQTGFIPTKALLKDIAEDIEALEGIYQCALAQERIAGDILSLAKIQMDMLSLHDIDMDLRREAKKVMGAFTTETKMKRIAMGLEFGASIDQAQVYGVKTDPVRLGQVITNLLANAIRFTASSEIRKITVKFDVSFVPPADDTCAPPDDIGLGKVPPDEDTPLWLYVSVRDTGPGLGEKELAQLFKRFSQGNNMIHTRYGGSGLGLFICRKITELLGGRIEVRSELGVGSVFRFFIQSRSVAPPERPALSFKALALHDRENGQTSTAMDERSVTQNTVASVSSSAIAQLPSSTDGMHILIVEDNLINQTVLKRQITKAGLTCDVANNGLEGLNLIREADRLHRRAEDVKLYDCILMDLEMPIMDGLTAVKEIRMAEAAGTLSRQMVIALTGNARQGQIDQAIEAGMDDVVIKPYRLPNLLSKISDMATRRPAKQ